jgi:hypothetical protein
MTKKQLGIFFIDVNKAYFYGSNTPSVLHVDIPTDTISFFDVVNKEKFYQIIQTLITTNKIQPVPLLILFSPSATYEKDPEGKTPEEVTTAISHFLEIVPHERVLSRTYKIQEKTKVVAVNKDMYEVIKHTFEKLGFTIVSVAALPLLQKTMPEIGTALNLELIANKFETVKQYSLITLEEINNPSKLNQQESEFTKPNRFRLFGLIGVFVVLIGILVFMVITTFQPEKKQAVVKQLPAPVVTVIPTTAPTETPTPTVTPSGKGGTPVPTLSPLPHVTLIPTQKPR